MQRYATNSATRLRTPSPASSFSSSGKCSSLSVNDLLTYILIFFLVILICYTGMYVWRMATQKPKTNENFEGGPRNKIVALFSKTCPFCVKFEPIFTNVIDKYRAQPNFNQEWSVVVEYDTNVAQQKYGVTGFPTVVVTKNDQIVAKQVGFVEEAQFTVFVERQVSLAPTSEQEEILPPPPIPSRVIAFFMSGCPYCEKFSPVFSNVTKDMQPKLSAKNVSVQVISDTNEARTKYQVTSFPTLVVYKGDERVDTKVGYMPEDAFRIYMENTLARL